VALAAGPNDEEEESRSFDSSPIAQKLGAWCKSGTWWSHTFLHQSDSVKVTYRFGSAFWKEFRGSVYLTSAH